MQRYWIDDTADPGVPREHYSYVPLARLDASGDRTDQGGLGTTDDAALPPLPLGEGGGEGHPASKTIAARASQTGAEGPNHSKPAANDAEALYWASLNQQAEQKAQALAIKGWGTGTDGPARQTAQAKIAEVYYFHTDQVGLPEELSNSQGQLVWQATYKTWGNTQAEEWKLVEADGSKTHPLDAGDQPENEARQQNLRFQGQYLDRDTGLHYNTFRFYDPDIGRFISPDPIGLEGGINLGSYSPNPISWIDPWGWAKCGTARKNRTPSPKNKNIDHARTHKNSDGSTTYYDKKGNAVTYDKNGNPDFTPYAEKIAESSKYNGKRGHDNRIANKEAGLSALGNKAPKGKVWHHVSKDQMILMDKGVHDTFPHTGSASILIHG